jgi:hypothetical protein
LWIPSTTDVTDKKNKKTRQKKQKKSWLPATLPEPATKWLLEVPVGVKDLGY